MKPLALSLALLALCLFVAPGSARASGSPGFAPDPGWYPLAGANLGVAVQGPGTGVLLGMELSAPYLGPDLLWSGVWADALWNSCTDTGQFGFGPELGWAYFGADFGYLGQFGGRLGGDLRHGLRGRAFFTLGLGAIYLGYTEWFGTGGPNRAASLGLLFKFPIVKNP